MASSDVQLLSITPFRHQVDEIECATRTDLLEIEAGSLEAFQRFFERWFEIVGQYAYVAGCRDGDAERVCRAVLTSVLSDVAQPLAAKSVAIWILSKTKIEVALAIRTVA